MRNLKADWRGVCARGTDAGNIIYDLYIFRGHPFRVYRSNGLVGQADDGDLDFIKESEKHESYGG